MVAKERDQFIKLTGVLNAYTIRDIEAELNSYLEKAKDILKIDINSILYITKIKYGNC